MSNQDALPGGHRVRWYEIESLIGRGALCHTYLATDHNLQRQVVIKEFFPGKICVRQDDFSVVPASGQVTQAYQSLRDNFIAEAKTLAQYRLEHIVQVHTTFELNQTAYLVMTYEQGQSLASMIAESSAPLEQKLLQDILLPILDGLSKIHKVHIIHGDINPSNIIVREYGAPVLVDFGSSRSNASQMRWQHNLPSCLNYAPIELLSGTAGTPGVWSDIYSLAATLYHSVASHRATGAMERAGAVVSGRTDPFRPLSRPLIRQYDHHFLEAINTGLALQPQQRPQSLLDWEYQLRNIENPHQSALSIANNNALLPKKSDTEPFGVHRVSAPESENKATVSVEALKAEEAVMPRPPNVLIEPPLSASVEVISPAVVTAQKPRWPHAGLVAGIALLVVSGVYLGMSNNPGVFLQAANREAVQDNAMQLSQRLATTADDTAGTRHTGIITTAAEQSVDVVSGSLPDPVPVVNPQIAAASPDSEQVVKSVPLETVAIPEKHTASDSSVDAADQLPPLTPAEPLQFGDLLSSINCDAVAPTDIGLKPGGVITTTALNWLKNDFPDTGAKFDSKQLVVLDDVFCAPLSVLKSVKDTTQVSLTTVNDNNSFREGDRLVLDLAVTAFADNYVYVDYFAMDGSVLHMLSSKSTTDSTANQLTRGESMLLGEAGDIERWDISQPYGNELISVLVSDEPLDIESVEEVENAQDYLDRINRVLASGKYKTASTFIPITIEE